MYFCSKSILVLQISSVSMQNLFIDTTPITPPISFIALICSSVKFLGTLQIAFAFECDANAIGVSPLFFNFSHRCIISQNVVSLA